MAKIKSHKAYVIHFKSYGIYKKKKYNTKQILIKLCLISNYIFFYTNALI